MAYAAEDGQPASDAVGYVPYDKRLYDALMHSFQEGADRRRERTVVGPRASASARPRVVVHAPLELLVGCSDDAVAEIAGVGPVAAEVVRRLACDAHVDLAVEDPEGSILNQGRARRDPTPVQRLEIDRRDKGCRFSGCNYTEFTHVHHIQHWADGGLTNLDNLVTLCDRHHRAVHELGWTVKGDANGVLTFTGPHGRPSTSAPSPTWRRVVASVRPAESDRDRLGVRIRNRIGTVRSVVDGVLGAVGETVRLSGARGDRSRGSAPSIRWESR